MMTAAPIFDSLSALADPIRCRILLLVERRELAVAELVDATQLPQSTISRHLKVLADEGFVSLRVDGNSNRYRLNTSELSSSEKGLWDILRKESATTLTAAEDSRRLQRVLSARRSRSQSYFSSSAGQWERIRSELFGRESHLLSLLSLLDPEWVVGDLGCGTGLVSEALAPFVRQVIAVDDSSAMISAARSRLAGIANVDVRKGDVGELPIENDSLDAAVVFLVLQYIADPADALAEVARVLRPGGRATLVDMLPHDRSELATEMGHQWQGFSREQLEEWCGAAGLTLTAFRAIPPDAEARGPSLFAATVSLTVARQAARKGALNKTRSRRTK